MSIDVIRRIVIDNVGACALVAAVVAANVAAVAVADGVDHSVTIERCCGFGYFSSSVKHGRSNNRKR